MISLLTTGCEGLTGHSSFCPGPHPGSGKGNEEADRARAGVSKVHFAEAISYRARSTGIPGQGHFFSEHQPTKSER